MRRTDQKTAEGLTAIKEHFVRIHVFVSGYVQGVDFRWHTQNKAKALGLTGWMRDLLDDRVEAIFEREGEAVQQAIDWRRVGTPPAWVDSIEISYEQPSGDFDRFHITW